MAAVEEFTSLVSGVLCPSSPFELLPPPTTVGFLKLSRPCCYVFPAGRGDCAFFAINGFTVLVDGGSDPQACFWKLVRHLDRIDAVLLTHIGTENLTGVNTFLERKVAEMELSSDIKEDPSRRLISPELGVVFFNAPNKLQVEQQPCKDTTLRSSEQAASTLQLLKKLNIKPQPMVRTAPMEPVTLFQKMGVGQLDLYILSPSKNSQEYQNFVEKWPDVGASGSQTLPLTALTSVSALLVWLPACPQEKVVRVLFPGTTPQAKLLQGFEKLKTLPFLQKPTVTTEDLERLEGKQMQGKEVTLKLKETPVKEKGKLMNGAEKNTSKEGGRKQKSADKNVLKKGTAKKEENGVARNHQSKKEAPPVTQKNETKMKKEVKNDSKAGVKKAKKPSGTEASRDKKASKTNDATKRGKTSEDSEQESLKAGRGSQGTPSVSATPKDMTGDIPKLKEGASGEEGSQVEKLQTTEGCKEDRVKEEVSLCSGLNRGDVEEVQSECQEPERLAAKPERVMGFPSPLNKVPKSDRTVQLDLTPTEYTLLDGALRSNPSSRSSPENHASADERTVEQASSESRPNSAGHTPYCLSPDDVWCNRSALSRPQMSSESSTVNQASTKQSEGQVALPPKSAPEGHPAPREKHLSFLSLGPLKEAATDRSPSVATTTTHSMPAEVSSPQSTEVDESLSMSLEQGPSSVSHRDTEDSIHLSHSNGGHYALPIKKPPRSLGPGPEMGRPPAPASLHFGGSTHDVDLCLVSPCEFKHFKALDSGGASEASKGAFGSHLHSSNNNHQKDMSPSETNAPPCTEDFPSTTADGVLDSDEDDSCSEPTNSPRDLRASQALPPDPPPAPLRDSPPLPPHPDTTMPVPLSDSDGKRATSTSVRVKKNGVVDGPQKPGSGRTKHLSGVTKIKKDSSAPTRTSSTRSAPAKSSPSPESSSCAEDFSVFVDLAYIPPTVTVDFFRCVRSSCYIISGDSAEREELLRSHLDSLLEGKSAWSEAIQVTVIPTFESVCMQEWYQQTLEQQKELEIIVLGSNSTVAMQDETFPACKIEF
ncbi:microtubule-associated protein 1S-like [Synchiropus picturatus]